MSIITALFNWAPRLDTTLMTSICRMKPLYIYIYIYIYRERERERERESLRLGELELNLEFNLMQLSVEDFENKIQVNPDAPDCCHWHFPLLLPSCDAFWFLSFSVGLKRDAIKQTYERSVKAAQDYGIMKESLEFVFLCFEKKWCFHLVSIEKLIPLSLHAGLWSEHLCFP